VLTHVHLQVEEALQRGSDVVLRIDVQVHPPLHRITLAIFPQCTQRQTPQLHAIKSLLNGRPKWALARVQKCITSRSEKAGCSSLTCKKLLQSQSCIIEK